MYKYITYCTDEQTERASRLDQRVTSIPAKELVERVFGGKLTAELRRLLNPSTEAMIGWLFTQGVIVGLSDVTALSNDGNKFCVFVSAREPYHITSFCADTYGEAVLQAIDNALTYLETEKK